MFERGYRQRLEADLAQWVANGVISGDAAQSIRTARFGEEAESRLPAIFAMLGALMLAASVSAFVAANWQEIPRLVKAYRHPHADCRLFSDCPATRPARDAVGG